MWFTSWNVELFEAINGLAGHWPTFDKLLSLALRNELVKAVPVGMCLCAAWHAKEQPSARSSARATLLLVLCAALLAAGSSKLISRSSSMPRPYVMAETVYRLQGNGLIEQPRWTLRTPSDNSSQLRRESLQNGRIPPNDMGTFPSDHAALFVALALGISLVSRGWGALALAWTCAVVLLPRVVIGLHSPHDIVGGAAVALASLAVVLPLGRYLLEHPLRAVAEWTTRHEAVCAGLLFFVAFEICCTFDHAEALLASVLKGIS